MTTLATLTRVEGSMLGALAEALSDDEVLFIDRDGPCFRYVLNYLRDPFAKPLLPRDPTDRDQLAREADFYGIPALSYGMNEMNLAGPFGASRGNQVATINTNENYELAFTMELALDWTHVSVGARLPSTRPSRRGEWQSILHIGHSNDQRLPAIQFHNTRNGLSVGQAPGYWGVPSTTGVTFTAGGTYEIKVVVESNQMTVYVDGAIVGTASGPATATAQNAPVYVGAPWHLAAEVTLSDISYTGR